MFGAVLAMTAGGLAASAQQAPSAPRAGMRSSDTLQFRFRLGGERGADGAIVVLAATADKRPPGPCLAGAGLFAITPDGFSIVFPRRRSELPFQVEEQVSPDQRTAALVFTAPACRMTIEIEKEVRRGGEWVRVAPVAPASARRR